MLFYATIGSCPGLSSGVDDSASFVGEWGDGLLGRISSFGISVGGGVFMLALLEDTWGSNS